MHLGRVIGSDFNKRYIDISVGNLKMNQFCKTSVVKQTLKERDPLNKAYLFWLHENELVPGLILSQKTKSLSYRSHSLSLDPSEIS